MVDENQTEHEEEKTFDKSQVEDIVKKRLKRLSNNDTRDQQLTDLQAKYDQLQIEHEQSHLQQATPPVEQAQGQPPIANQSQVETPNVPMQNHGITPDQMQSMLDNQAQQQQQLQQQQKDMQESIQNNNEHRLNMESNLQDPEFKKLIEDNEDYVNKEFPGDLAVYISKSLDKSNAKKMFIKILSDEGVRNKVENSYLKDDLARINNPTAPRTNIDNLIKSMFSSESTNKDAPNAEPDLSLEDSSSDSGADSSAIDDYILNR